MIALILCAGEHTRWTGSLPKQLADIGGERLLERTQRQCDERGLSCIVVSHVPLILAYAGRWWQPDARRWACETLLSTQVLWDDLTLVLLGDVCYSDAAMDRILYTRQPVAVFGTSVEIFAVTFQAGIPRISVRGQVRKALTRAVEAARQRQGDGKLWDFYRSYCKLETGQMEDKVFVKIDDYTTDFDSLEAYQEFVRSNPWAGTRSPRVASASLRRLSDAPA